MQMAFSMLLPLAWLVTAGHAASIQEHSASAIEARRSKAVALLLRSQGPNKVDTTTLVASLVEVAKGLQMEDKKALAYAKGSKSDCRATARKLDLAMKKGQRAFDMATDEYQKTDAQVSALEASLAELKGQIESSNTELDRLQKKLKTMRTDKGLLKKSAAKSLRQVETVIAKTYVMENLHKGPSALDLKVSSLEQLSKGLSFLQAGESKKEGAKQTPALLLKQDKQAIVQASDATQAGFDEDEKKVLELIELERKKLEELEDNLEDMQPAISNKLKQAMEINRTLDASSRGLERDTALLDIETKKCKVIEDALSAQKKLRAKATTDVQMAYKVLEHMDTALFLTRDLAGLKRSTSISFLQEESESDSEEETSPSSSSSAALVQDASTADITNLLENAVGTGAASISEGPFDKVNKMIQGLIASLKAQANEEVNQQQFCEDSLGKNRRDRTATKNNMDTLSATIRWSKMAIVRLDDDIKYLDSELKRLDALATAEAGELKEEEKRVGKEMSEHKLADEVITKAIVILNQLCGLNGASALIQEGSEAATHRASVNGSLVLIQRQTSKVGSRFSQCKEAAELLKSASKEVKNLDQKTSDYLGSYKTLSGGITKDTEGAKDARNKELTATQSQRAQRASELATAAQDASKAKDQLKLIEEAKKELEHSCSHVETPEEKMARRKEEIDALKEALGVLEGEEIPVS